MERTTALARVVALRSGAEAADRRDSIDRRGIRGGRVLGGVIALLGAVLAGGGLWLIVLGDSPYYLLSGVGYMGSGVLLSRRRPAGAWLAVALLGATVCWALWEAGLNYWALFPRVMLPAGLALLGLFATLRFPTNKLRRVTAGAAGVLALLIAVEFAFAFVPHDGVHSLPARSFVSAENCSRNDRLAALDARLIDDTAKQVTRDLVRLGLMRMKS